MKKLSISFLTILICVSLTGCSILDIFAFDKIVDGVQVMMDNATNEATEQKRMNLVTNLSVNARSSSTDSAMQEYISAKEAYTSASNTWWIPKWFPFAGANAKKAKMDIAFSSLETKAASDSVYQDSLLHGIGDVTNPFSKLLAAGAKPIAIVVLVFLGIMMILFFRAYKKKAKYDAKAAKAVARVNAQVVKEHARAIPASASAPELPLHREVDTKEYQKVAITDENYMRMLAENCQRLGANPQALLAECGSLEAAYQKSNLLIAMQNQ